VRCSIVTPLHRTRFTETRPDVLLLDPHDRAGIEGHLLQRNLASQSEFPARIESPGSGNMNLTLRVTLAGRSLILKQGRPWVEKYDHIEAPWDRTLIEGRFYEAVRGVGAVSSHMPEILDLDPHNRVVALSDAGCLGDFTSIYAGGEIPSGTVGELLDWLDALGSVGILDDRKDAFTNRAMRALNHEHIFRLPLARDNGLDLDRITEGLARAAEDLKADADYAASVKALGSRYLEDGAALVHGDYFPGSWLKAADGIRVIDPEFCFLGAREFDYGVMLAHLALARTRVDPAQRVLAASQRGRLDTALVCNFAGVEIMRRLIGLAQLPLSCDLSAKRRLLDISRSLVLTPQAELSCW
jgi:5-methylthioribose kinase